MNRKEYNLLVESWKNFLNESPEDETNKEIGPHGRRKLAAAEEEAFKYIEKLYYSGDDFEEHSTAIENIYLDNNVDPEDIIPSIEKNVRKLYADNEAVHNIMSNFSDDYHHGRYHFDNKPVDTNAYVDE